MTLHPAHPERAPEAPPGPATAAEPATQLAALCWRKGEAGREVLLVTSSSGRWILPKGWPMAGKSEGAAALAEAWEEGGVKGKVSRRPLGAYLAPKRTPEGDIPTLQRVYAVKVREETARFPESARRDRLWVSPEEAARLVDEDGLRDILRAF